MITLLMLEEMYELRCSSLCNFLLSSFVQLNISLVPKREIAVNGNDCRKKRERVIMVAALRVKIRKGAIT
jgi:hypothetical protein